MTIINSVSLISLINKMSETVKYTAIKYNTLADKIYEGSINDNNEVVIGYNEKWTDGSNNDLINTLPLAITEKQAWTDFWSKYELYIGVPGGGGYEEHDFGVNSEFVYIEYLGNSSTRTQKVYACSPNKGLYTLTVSGNHKLVATQVLNNGCCHIDYNTNTDRFLICSDNRTTLGTSNCLMVWNGLTSSPQLTVQKNNLPFHISGYGRLWHNGNFWIYGYILGARNYDSSKLWTAESFGAWYIKESDLATLDNTKIYKCNAYIASNGAQPPADRDKYNVADVKQLDFTYIRDNTTTVNNHLWVIATNGSTNNNNLGEDVLIAQCDSTVDVIQFYRYRFRNSNDNVKCSKILYSKWNTTDSGKIAYAYNNSNGEYIKGNSFCIISCYEPNICPYWFPGSFHPVDEASVRWDNDYFLIRPFNNNESQSVANNQWLSCLDLDNFALLGGGGGNSSNEKYLYKLNYEISHDSDNWRPKYMNRPLVHLSTLTQKTSIYHYLHMCVLGNNDDVYICGHGGVIRLLGMKTKSYNEADTVATDDYLIEEGTIIMNIACNDEKYIYAIGYSHQASTINHNIAVVIGTNIITNSLTTSASDVIKTTSPLDVNNSVSIKALYEDIETNVLDVIKAGKSSTYSTAYNKLIACQDADIVDYLLGRRNHLYSY